MLFVLEFNHLWKGPYIMYDRNSLAVFDIDMDWHSTLQHTAVLQEEPDFFSNSLGFLKHYAYCHINLYSTARDKMGFEQ